MVVVVVFVVVILSVVVIVDGSVEAAVIEAAVVTLEEDVEMEESSVDDLITSGTIVDVGNLEMVEEVVVSDVVISLMSRSAFCSRSY